MSEEEKTVIGEETQNLEEADAADCGTGETDEKSGEAAEAACGEAEKGTEASSEAGADAESEEDAGSACGGEAEPDSADDGKAEADGAEGGDGAKKPGRRELKALEKKDEEIRQITDRYMRTLAEYENFRKRTEKEKQDLYSYAVKDVMAKILPVLDNVERGIAAIPEESKDDPIAEGMDKIGKQFMKALDDIGIKPIEAEGQPFNPDLHNAVMHVEDEALGDNIVAEEFLKGYTYRDTVVRHSMVKVAN